MQVFGVYTLVFCGYVRDIVRVIWRFWLYWKVCECGANALHVRKKGGGNVVVAGVYGRPEQATRRSDSLYDNKEALLLPPFISMIKRHWCCCGPIGSLGKKKKYDKRSFIILSRISLQKALKVYSIYSMAGL